MREKFFTGAGMRAIDLFSGAGGMSIGAAMSGVDVRYAVELDKHAASTFALNHNTLPC